jgi:histidine triad (HIT) family protein
MPEPCPFCEIVAGRGPATIVNDWPVALAIVPLNPVTDGHHLIIPKVHVTSAMEAGTGLFGAVMECAAEMALWALEPCNLITSCGQVATQTVRHLHVHYVPRRPDDGLALPWTTAETSDAATPQPTLRDTCPVCGGQWAEVGADGRTYHNMLAGNVVDDRVATWHCLHCATWWHRGADSAIYQEAGDG